MNIVIVDDELLSRTALRMMVEKNCPNITVIGEAENGMQAVEICKKLKPDIVGMDIKMPVMDGITATGLILKELPKTIILVITAYSDTECLQEAINVGAKGYFLKPLKAGDIAQKLNSIYQEFSSGVTKTPVNMEKLILKPLIDKEIVHYLIAGIADSPRLNYLVEYSGYSINSGFFIVVNFFEITPNAVFSSTELDSVKSTIYSTISYLFNFFRKGIIGDFDGQLLPIFIPENTYSRREYHQQESLLIGKEILQRLSSFLDVTISIAISELVYNAELFQDIYESTARISQQLEGGSIVYANNYREKKYDITYPYTMEEKIRNNILNFDDKKVQQDVIFFLECIFQNRWNLTIVREYTLQFMCFLKRLLFEMGIDSAMIDEAIPIGKTVFMVNFTEFEHYTKTCASKMVELVLEIKENKNYGLIRKIKKYIDDNLNSVISLADLSSRLALSPQYVSKIFKTEFKVGFSDYVSNTRVEKGKLFLEKTSMSIAEISHKCGCVDQNYFTKIFKKRVGLTPKNYRRMFYENKKS